MLWSLSWPAVGALACVARHWRGLWLPVGYALGQVGVTVPLVLNSAFGALGWAFVAAGTLVALALAIAVLCGLKLLTHLRSRKEDGSATTS